MFCPHCGTENADDAWTCRACGAPVANPYEASAAAPGVALPTGHVYNWLVPSVVATVIGGLGVCLCCLSVAALPTGIVSIVYAAQVNGLERTGNIAGAVHAAKFARNWCLVSYGIIGLSIVGSMGAMVVQLFVMTRYR